MVVERVGSILLDQERIGRQAVFLVGGLLQAKALIMISFADILRDKGVITSTTFTALLLMAVGSTMLTRPCATPLIARPGERVGAEA